MIFLAWGPGLRGPYHFDDQITPLQDPASQSITAFASSFTTTLRPLTKLTFATESSLGLVKAPQRRIFQFILHASSAFVFFLILSHFSSFILANFLTALLWLLHPINAETVLSLAGRSSALSSLFILLSLLMWLEKRVKLTLIFWIFAVIAKETTFGFIFLFIADLILNRPCMESFEYSQDRKDLKRSLWGLFFLMLLGFVFIFCNHRFRELMAYSFLGLSWGVSVIQQISAIPLGISLYVRPWALSLDHGEIIPHSLMSLLFWEGILMYLLLLATSLKIYSKGKFQALALGSLFVIFALLPTQSIIPKLDPLTERPFALALLGFLLPLVCVESIKPSSCIERASSLSKFWLLHRMKFIVFVLLALNLWFFVGTKARAQLYQSELLLWEDAASKSVSNARPFVNFAAALLKEDRFEEAKGQLIRSLQIDPFDTRVERELSLVNDKLKERNE